MEHYDKMFRLKAFQKNNQTNFVHEDGFEKKIEEKRNMGPLPHKGKIDQDASDLVKADLKRSHILLGKDTSSFDFTSSSIVGDKNLQTKLEHQY